MLCVETEGPVGLLRIRCTATAHGRSGSVICCGMGVKETKKVVS